MQLGFHQDRSAILGAVHEVSATTRKPSKAWVYYSLPHHTSRHQTDTYRRPPARSKNATAYPILSVSVRLPGVPSPRRSALPPASDPWRSASVVRCTANRRKSGLARCAVTHTAAASPASAGLERGRFQGSGHDFHTRGVLVGRPGSLHAGAHGPKVLTRLAISRACHEPPTGWCINPKAEVWLGPCCSAAHAEQKTRVAVRDTGRRVTSHAQPPAAG